MREGRSAFGSGVSTKPTWRAALDEAAELALAPLGGEAPDLAILFTTPQHAHAARDLGPKVRERTEARVLLGSTAQAVIGGGREVEDGPGLAIFAARLEGVDVRPFSIAGQEERDPPVEAWRGALPVKDGDRGVLLLVADPFTLELPKLLDTINDAWPGLPVAGGVASGGMRPGGNRLYCDEETRADGAVGAFLAGAEARTVVSQGCRPIGKHMVITKAKGHVIETIGGKPALQALRDVIAGVDERDRALASRALHVGRVIDEARDTFGRGDFLIRNPIGADPSSGALAVGDTFRPGQTIQFQVRDAQAADEDLRHLLDEAVTAEGRRAALLFSCNGRGKRFFGTPDHDSGVIREKLGASLPVAGFFCGGEFGPIGGRNFLHGYTSTIVLF